MKRVLFVTSLILFSCSVFAQNAVRFGFTTSPGFTWLKPDNKNLKSDGLRFGFSYGAIVDFNIDNSDRYFITSGLNIAMDGGKLIGTPITKENASSMMTAKIQYLELPIGLKLRSNESANNLTYYGTLGLVNGFRIRSRADLEYTNPMNPENFINETNIKIEDIPFYPYTIERIKAWQLSLQFEGGVEYRVAENTSLVGGVYFRNGFTDTVKSDDEERVVNRHFGIRLAVMF